VVAFNVDVLFRLDYKVAQHRQGLILAIQSSQKDDHVIRESGEKSP
jgi:hypothetical protein